MLPVSQEGQRPAIPDVNTIRNGSVDAKALQQTLKDVGLYKGKIDGVLGKGTRDAYNQYIASNNSQQANEEDSWSKVNKAVEDPSYVRSVNAQYGGDLYYGSEYDKILEKPTNPNWFRTLGDAINDGVNLGTWILATSLTKKDDTGNKTIDKGWNVSNDALTRAVSLLPDNLNEKSAKDLTSFDKAKGGIGYPNTWDSNDYVTDNETAFTRFLGQRGDILGLAGQAFAQPGRGSVGNLSYRTTPEGLEISDGYEFAADPNKVIINSDKQNGAYNKLRAVMNDKFRATNTKAQRYFIPWDVYNKIHGSDD